MESLKIWWELNTPKVVCRDLFDGLYITIRPCTHLSILTSEMKTLLEKGVILNLSAQLHCLTVFCPFVSLSSLISIFS